MTDSEKIFTAGCAAGAAFAAAPAVYGLVKNAIPKPIAENDRLMISDGQFVTKGGKSVFLRGMNLNDDIFFCKKDGEDFNEPVESIYSSLKSRFGGYGARKLISEYENSFISDADLKTVYKLGANCVRVPLRYYLLFGKDECKGDADFERLDRLVEKCRKLGLYVILDCHEAPENLFDGGKQGFDKRNSIVRFWSKIAVHYKDEPAVAAYDLLNRPLNNVADVEGKICLLHTFYNRIFKAIRHIDGEKTVIMQWAGYINSLPDAAKYKDKNVAFGLYSHFHTTFETDAMIKNADRLKNQGVPFIVCKIRTDDNWNYSLGRLCDSGVSWLAGDYKGSGRSKLFGGETAFADISSESYDELTEKWKTAPASKNFTQNKELAKTLKLYFSKYAPAETDSGKKPDINVKLGLHIIKGMNK